MTLSPLTQKLRFGADLSANDIAKLESLAAAAVKIPAGDDLTIEGDEPEFVHFVSTGTACRYKYLKDGGRAIVALMLPGDFCDLHVAVLGHMDHSISALTDCQITRVAFSDLNETLVSHPSIHRACLWATLVDEAILREWLVNVGRRSSEEQVAHLFCELHTRLEAVGLTDGATFNMPFTQATLGDLLGMSAVHVQRIMSGLRTSGLIAHQGQSIRIPDFAALADLGGFDPNYLHLQRSNQKKKKIWIG